MGKLTTEVFNESCCDGGAQYNSMSAQSCGCDPGSNWTCERHYREQIAKQDAEAKEGITLQGEPVTVVIPIDAKPSNPKDVIGSDKLPLGLVPASSIAYQTLGHLEGNLKYGLVNWREMGVRFSIYYDACLRHLTKLNEGEWADPKTNVPHLGNALACLGIIVDAYECGKLVDDRPMSAPVAGLIDRFSENVKHLKDMFKEHHPHHYTIADGKESE